MSAPVPVIDPASDDDGPAVNAFWWLQAVLEQWDFATAWEYTDPVYRLARAQAWWYQYHDDLGIDALTAPALAEAWAAGRTTEGDLPDLQSGLLWDLYCGVEVRLFRQAWPGWLKVTGGDHYEQTRVIGPGLESVGFITETDRVCPVLMHRTDGEWRVLHVGAESAPEPGWPPVFPLEIFREL